MRLLGGPVVPGYIGSVVTTLLVEAGHQVTVRGRPSTAATSPRSRREGGTFVKARLQEAADEVLGSADFDGVLHFAGFIEVGERPGAPRGTGTTMSPARWACSTRCTATESAG